ncbi:MAG TPA: type II toxin-antitoxin system HicB family antitoxin [Stellaceae bacterium]|nr:type II toxin-antitoxin system HicB family antitoxin [Stellaceae bacterium]
MPMIYTYPARLEPDEDGRLVVHFPDLPEALTDGADRLEALTEASDCLSEALASRIVDCEEIPTPSPAGPDMYLVSPEPTIALKVALYSALRAAGITVEELGQRLGIDDREAGRLLSPRARTRLARLEEALSALGYTIGIEVRERRLA